MRTAVIGTGAWGTAFAAVLADAGQEVTMWGRRAEVCAEITERRTNEAYLPGTDLPAITATTDAAAAVRGARIVAVAVPAQTARETLAQFVGLIEPDAVVVSLMKGVELGTDLRMSQVLGEALDLPRERVAVVSGPNLAKEIAAHQPTATVVAAHDPAAAELVAGACANAYFRPYTNGDVVGVELSGAVKNVIALAVGMAEGMGLGDNTKSSIITRGLAEMTRLGVALGADARTFAGLAGVGVLIATCMSPLSRNHSFGVGLGQGMTLEQAERATGGTAEAVKSSRSVLDLAASAGVEMPITAAVAAMVHDGLPVDEMTQRLLARPRKAEGVAPA